MDVYGLDPGNPVCNQSRVMNAILFSCWQFLQQLSWLPMAGNGLHSAPPIYALGSQVQTGGAL
jgi:hypothetical protein